MCKHSVHFFVLITFLLIVHQSTAVDLSAFNQTELAGRFTVFYATGVDPRYKIDLDFTGYKLRIIGCNKHNAQFNFTSQTKAFLMGKLNSTNWRCLVEDDDAVVNTLIATRKMYRYGSQIVGEDEKGNVILKAQLIGTIRSLNQPFLGVQRQGGYTVGNVLLFPGSNNNSNTGLSNFNNQNNPQINSLNTINTVSTTPKVPTKTTQPTALPSFSPYNLITDSITPSSLYGMPLLLKNSSLPTSSITTNVYNGSTSIANSISLIVKTTPDASAASTESKSVINTAFSVNNSLSNSGISSKSNLTTPILTSTAKQAINSSLVVSLSLATSLNSTPVLVNSNTDKLINQTIGLNKSLVTDQNISNLVSNSGVSSQSVTSSSSLINKLSKQSSSVPVANISEKGKVSEKVLEENNNILVAQSLNLTQPINRGTNITNNSSISSVSIVSANSTSSLISQNSKQPAVSTASQVSENSSTSSASSSVSSSFLKNSSNSNISTDTSTVSLTSTSTLISSNISTTSQISSVSTSSQANQSKTTQELLSSGQNISSAADLSKKLAQLVKDKKGDLNKTILSSDVSQNLIKEDVSLLIKKIQNIVGQYIFILPPLNVDVDNKNFIVNGCNIHAYNIEINQYTKQASLAPLTSTTRTCAVDFDIYYKNAIKKSKYITNTTNGFQIRDQNRNIVLQLSQHQLGNYLMSFPPVEMNITEDSIIFQGCNTNYYEYFLDHSNGDLKLGQSSTTNKICLFNDFDEIMRKALTSSTYILSIQKGLAFKLFDEILGIAYQSHQKTKTAQIVEINSLQNLPILITPNLFDLIISDYKENQLIPSLPGVSASSIKGTYNFVSDNLQPVFIQFDEEYLQFESCNINRIPYALYTDDAFFILEAKSSTQRICSINNDLKYIQLLQQVTRVKKTQNGFILMQDEKQLATLSLRVRNDVLKFNIINGAYSLQVTGLQAIISASQISIKGCNLINIPYKFETLGEIKFGDLIVASGSCTWDVDSFYAKAILRSKFYKQVAEGFVLTDQKGVETVKFINTLGNQKIKRFNGNFVVKLPSAGFKLRIIDGNFILSGCNQHTFKYSLADDGTVVFGNPSSTKIACQVDNDNVFLFALLKSRNIAISGDQIILNNGNKQSLIKITNIDSKQPKKTTTATKIQEVEINQPQEYKLKDGKYSIALLRSSFPKLNFTIEGKKSILKGCNSITLYYNASSDKKISFENKSIQSSNVCKDDFDSFYINALNSIRKYEQSAGIYTLFNDKGASTLSIIANSLTGATQVSTANYQNVTISNVSTVPVSIASIATASIKSTNITTSSANLKVQTNAEAIKKDQKAETNSDNNENKDKKRNNQDSITIDTNITSSSSSSKVSSINSGANDTLPLLDITGEYNFQLPQISLQVVGNSLVFKSCNTHRFPFVVSNGKYLLGNAISTKKECKNDLDNYYISMIQKITKSSQIDNKLTLFNNLLQSQFSIQPTRASSSSPSQTLTSGTYHAYLPSTNISISNNSVRIKGCKNEIIAYKTDENNKILFTDNKNIDCSSLYHSIIARQIKKGIRIRKIENGFQLLDQDGNKKGVFLFAGAN